MEVQYVLCVCGLYSRLEEGLMKAKEGRREYISVTEGDENKASSSLVQGRFMNRPVSNS